MFLFGCMKSIRIEAKHEQEACQRGFVLVLMRAFKWFSYFFMLNGSRRQKLAIKNAFKCLESCEKRSGERGGKMKYKSIAVKHCNKLIFMWLQMHWQWQNELRKKHVEAEAFFRVLEMKREREREIETNGRKEDGRKERNGTICSSLVSRLSNTATDKRKRKKTAVLSSWRSLLCSFVANCSPEKSMVAWCFKLNALHVTEKNSTPVWHLGGASYTNTLNVCHDLRLMRKLNANKPFMEICITMLLLMRIFELPYTSSLKCTT